MEWLYLDRNTKPTADVIEEVVNWHKTNVVGHLQELKDYYDGVHPILRRQKPDPMKNNKLVINHAKYITEINVGYLLANPVKYIADKSASPDSLVAVLEEYKKQSMPKIDKKLARHASIYGAAYELVYIDEQSQPRSAVLDPRNVVFVRDNTVKHAPLFAVVYSIDVDATAQSSNQEVVYSYLQVYTHDEVLEFTNDGKRIAKRRPHYLGRLPVIEYLNEPDGKGDFEDVLTLINAYNTLQSDRVNDKEQLVEAILVLYGVQMDKDTREDLLRYRTLSADKDARLEYLTKTLQEDQVEILRKRIEEDIHKISMTPNLNDEKFAGNLSGVALEFKLMPFELKLKNKEDEFKAGLQNRLTIYQNAMEHLKIPYEPVEPYKVKIVFSRALPKNDFETSQMILNLRGLVDEETLISQLSFVEDAKATLEKVKKEVKEQAYGTLQPAEPVEEEEGTQNEA